MNKFYSIHDIIKVKTKNTQVPIPDYFRETEDKDDFEPDIEIIQGNLDVDKSKEEKKRRKDYFIWREGSALYIDYEVFNMKLLIDDLEGRTKIGFTNTYRRHGEKHLSNLINIVLAIKLIQKGYSAIHAGCISYRDRAILVSGMGSTGKTSVILTLLDGENKFMSDDQTIVSGNGIAYSYPEKVGISFQTLTGNMFSPSITSKIFGRLTKSHFISLFFGKFFNLWRMEQKEIPRELIADKAIVNKVFLITCGEEDEIKQIGKDEAVKKFMMSSVDEHSFFGSYSLNFYAYHLNFDLLEFAWKSRKVVEDAIKDAECFELKSNRTEKYPKLIKQIIGGDL